METLKHDAKRRRKSGSKVFQKRRYRGKRSNSASTSNVTNPSTVNNNENITETNTVDKSDVNISASFKKLKSTTTSVGGKDMPFSSSDDNLHVIPSCYILLDTDILKN